MIGPTSCEEPVIFFVVQSLNLCLLVWWADRRAKAKDLDRRFVLDLSLVVIVAGGVGGRLLHVLWEAPSYYLEHPLRVFDIASGGFIYFGGLVTAAGAGWLWIRHRHEPAGSWFDFFAPLVALGTAIGRVGCFLGGCCYGKVCDLPWAVLVTDENGLMLPRHPAPLYAALWDLGLLFLLLGLERRPASSRPAFLRSPGALFALWLLLHSAGRFLLEFIRDDFRGPALGGLTLGQWISVVLGVGAIHLMIRGSTAGYSFDRNETRSDQS